MEYKAAVVKPMSLNEMELDELDPCVMFVLAPKNPHCHIEEHDDAMASLPGEIYELFGITAIAQLNAPDPVPSRGQDENTSISNAMCPG